MPSKYPDNFPAGCVDGVALMGGVDKPLPRARLKFPTDEDWTPDPAVAIPEEAEKIDWRESLCEVEWNRAVTNLELGEWRPDAAWLHFLEGKTRVAPPFKNLRKEFEVEYDFDLLIGNVTHVVWQYFWKSNLHNRVDGIFHLARLLGGSGSENRERTINSLWAAIRKAVGLPQRRKGQKYLYTEAKAGTIAANKAALSSDLIAMFRHLPEVNKARAVEWTSCLLRSLKIETGSNEKISARIHAREYRSD